MNPTEVRVPRFAVPEVEVEYRDDGCVLLRSPAPLGPYPRQFGEHLRNWASVAPNRLFLVERGSESWSGVTYSEALSDVNSISQWLLDHLKFPHNPVMILSSNSVRHGLLTLAAMQIGIPVAPVSPAYSLMTRDYSKLRYIFDLVEPGLIYVENTIPFEGALESIDLDSVEIVAGVKSVADTDIIDFNELLSTAVRDSVELAYGKVGPDSVAKYLFTSGSTGMPKGVINTQRMLCANRQQNLQIWPFLEEEVVMVDWLPWNHTFGANANFKQVLASGGTLYIDSGRPTPGLIESTVRNLKEIAPTHYANVPAGFGLLLPYLEKDDELREKFFSRLKLIFYAGASLSQDLWDRLEEVSIAAVGCRITMVSAWGSTETAPLATGVHWPIERAGTIGLPVPGTEIKMVPTEGKLELRVRGPNVTPGYLKRPDKTLEAFDDEGFYRIGDAGYLFSPDEPERGLVFDGRVAENFKLSSGTFVHVGNLRVNILAFTTPVLQDLVIAGHDRDFVSVIAWLDIEGCRRVLCDENCSPETLMKHSKIIAHLRAQLTAYNLENCGSSTTVARIILVSEEPSIDANEITDKGYINQRAVLERRVATVNRLYADKPNDDVIIL